jgi:hypothetical protein
MPELHGVELNTSGHGRPGVFVDNPQLYHVVTVCGSVLGIRSCSCPSGVSAFLAPNILLGTLCIVSPLTRLWLQRLG